MIPRDLLPIHPESTCLRCETRWSRYPFDSPRDLYECPCCGAGRDLILERAFAATGQEVIPGMRRNGAVAG